MVFVICPARALGHVSPSANKRESFGERVDVTLYVVNAFDLPGKPVIGDAAKLMKIIENALKQIGMFGIADAALQENVLCQKRSI